MIAEYNEYTVISGSDQVEAVWPRSDDVTWTLDWPALRTDRAATAIVVRWSGLGVVVTSRIEGLLEDNRTLRNAIREELG